MQKLTRFKQDRKSYLVSKAYYQTPLAVLAGCAVAFTVVFNTMEGQCQTSSDPTVSAPSQGASAVDKPSSSSNNPPAAKGSDKGDQAEPSPTDKASEVSTTLSPTHVVKQSDDKMSTARPKEIKSLPNFHKVTDYLYRGGEPTPGGMIALKRMGVKTLIDLRAQTEAAHDEAHLAKKLGMKYINMTMTAEAPTKKQVETLLATIDSAKEKNEPVLVHCAHGSDRTGCMIGIWRVTRDNWSFDDTYKEMRKYYFGVKYDKLRNAVKERASH